MLCPTWTSLQAAEIVETFATEGTGIAFVA
jgi:hypothetical protein